MVATRAEYQSRSDGLHGVKLTPQDICEVLQVIEKVVTDAPYCKSRICDAEIAGKHSSRVGEYIRHILLGSIKASNWTQQLRKAKKYDCSEFLWLGVCYVP
jgi:hypothetical protein